MIYRLRLLILASLIPTTAFAAQPTLQQIRSLQDGDGESPQARLVEGADGFLYGTTVRGGSGGSGTVFKVSKEGSGFTVIKSFSGSDGDHPISSLVEAGGVLYGTTFDGGTNDSGTVFRLETNGDNFATLVSFTEPPNDGVLPNGGLLLASDGLLYGTTQWGGAHYRGTIFRLNTNGVGYTIVVSFEGLNGWEPMGELIEASDGNLYGVTRVGGTNGMGTIYRVGKDGSNLTVLRELDENNKYPSSALIEAKDGMLYGTTFGQNFSGGSVFRLGKDGNSFSTLATFDPDAPVYFPNGPLVEWVDGRLVGTSYGSRTNWGAGAIFWLNKNGSDFQVLHYFQTLADGGREPQAGVMLASNGSVYGTTSGGGQEGIGTLFKLTAAPTVAAPTITSFIPTQHQIEIQISGPSGLTCFLEWSTNLASSSWFRVATNTINGNGVADFIDTSANKNSNARRFYRTASP